tara:strand:- start:525 stop:1055 length:531 start_codon:yes stop_codon:yes gene_type:complete
MNRYQFEDLISLYLENGLSLKKRKEIEDFLLQNPDAKDLIKKVKANINHLENAPRVLTGKNFNEKLLNNISSNNFVDVPKRYSSLIFGFSTSNFSMILGLIVLLFFLVNEITSPFFDTEDEINNTFSMQDKSSNSTNATNEKDVNLEPVKNLTSADNDSAKSIKKDYSNKIQFVND